MFIFNDYPAWIAVIQKTILKHRPDADIIFSTYNWGYVDEKYRLELINNLPDGISVEPFWDIFGHVQIGDVKEQVSDYSLSFVGPSAYFKSEAIAAKKRNARLYVNGQMSGRTWDFGVVPYEPMPYQWIKRYQNLLDANKEWFTETAKDMSIEMGKEMIDLCVEDYIEIINGN